MSATRISRTISFDPAAGIIDFLGKGYTSKGVAQASLLSLTPIYPSDRLTWISNLRRKMSSNRPPGVPAADMDDSAFSVCMFKRFNHNLPTGLSSETFAEFFSSLFTFSTPEEKIAHTNDMAELLANPQYSILAITSPTVSTNTDPPGLSHFIVGAALFMHDNKNGTFVSVIGVSDKGDPSLCSLSPMFFEDPAHKNRLSETASFRGYGLAVFLLSALQVLGSLGYKAPHVPTSVPFHIECDENINDQSPTTHHLYLQARVEIGHAYSMYVQLGFINANGSFRCTSLRKDCPVNRTKKARGGLESGYSSDDDMLRLLVLKKWLVNSWPTSSSFSTTLHDATLVWNAPGLSGHEHLSSALVPPDTSAATQEFTNAVYYQLLECQHYIGQHPLYYHTPAHPDHFPTLPPDRMIIPFIREMSAQKMIDGLEFRPWDIRRSLFRSLVSVIQTPDGYDLDAFQAAAAAMYTVGDVSPNQDEDTTSLYEDRALELRLNVVSFYLRCAHFTISTPSLQAWAAIAVQEYDLLVTNSLVKDYLLVDFDGAIPSFSDNTEHRIKWDDNFRLLARRLTDTETPAMWFDLYALQLLFSEHESPVYFAPVYGRVVTTQGQRCGASPEVPKFDAMMSFEAATLVGDKTAPPPSFTVVPLHALTWYKFGFFSNPSFENSHESLCEQIAIATSRCLLSIKKPF
jgi:hypothetical protein